MFLKEDSEPTWNDSCMYYGHFSWEGQRNNLKWQLYQLWLCFLRRTAEQLEMIAIPIMGIFLRKDSETTWNDSFTCHGHVIWRGQRNYLKWQLYLFRPCFLWKTAKQPEITAICIMAMFLEEDSEIIWNDSYTYYGHVSWGGRLNNLKWWLYLL